MASPRRFLPIALGVGVAVFLVYVRALGAGFFSDDYTWLGRMPATLERPLYVLSVFYRDFNPLLHASFVLDYFLGGSAPWVYHLTSLLVHAACVSLLALLCRELGCRAWVAAVAALTWGINVRLSEAVIWPAARGHSLATMFVLAAMLCLTRASRARSGWATGLFGAALLSKEVAFFPLLIAPSLLENRGRRLRALIPLALLAPGFLAFHLFFKPVVHYGREGVAAALLKLPFVVLRPIGLGDLYGFSYPHFAIFALAFLGVAWLFRQSVALPGFVWLLACAVPILPLDKLSSRYLYMMSVGYALVLCGVMDSLSRWIKTPGPRRAAAALGGAALVLLGAANALFVQSEIEDYRLLSLPYAACLEALREPAASLRSGETLVVLDGSPRRAVREMNALVAGRGTIVKLIPERPQGVGGLIELADIVNIARPREPAILGTAEEPTSGARQRTYAYDGDRSWEVARDSVGSFPRERAFAARLGAASDYFARGATRPAP